MAEDELPPWVDARRRLRLVTPAHSSGVRVVPVADVPDAYTVRRVAGDASAIISRQATGWYVMYGHDGSADPAVAWRATATLSGMLDQDVAGRVAAELAEAFEQPPPAWHRLLAAVHGRGDGVLVEVVRLHRPGGAGGPGLFCAGCRDSHRLLWDGCPTVRLIAGLLDVDLNSTRLPAQPID